MRSFRDYETAFAWAIRQATREGRDFGLEQVSYFGEWSVWRLVPPECRFGHELRCQVVPPRFGLSAEQAQLLAVWDAHAQQGA